MSVIAKLAKDWIVSDIGSSESLNQAYELWAQHAQRGHSSLLHYGKVKVLSAIDLFHGVRISIDAESLRFRHDPHLSIMPIRRLLSWYSSCLPPIRAIVTAWEHSLLCFFCLYWQEEPARPWNQTFGLNSSSSRLPNSYQSVCAFSHRKVFLPTTLSTKMTRVPVSTRMPFTRRQSFESWPRFRG